MNHDNHLFVIILNTQYIPLTKTASSQFHLILSSNMTYNLKLFSRDNYLSSIFKTRRG